MPRMLRNFYLTQRTKSSVSLYVLTKSSVIVFTYYSIAERLDPLDLDVLLSELSMMCTHSERYWRFIKKRLGDMPLNEDEVSQYFILR